MKRKYSVIKIGALLMAVLFMLNTDAQLKGDHLLGDVGLNAGTQAPPTIIAALPFYWYDASRLKNSNVRTSFGVRWLDEFSADNRFEGNTFLISLGYIVKSLEKKEQ
jgi:hypothetical protein